MEKYHHKNKEEITGRTRIKHYEGKKTTTYLHF